MFKNFKLKTNRGMTLVELLVSIAIFVVISTIMIFNYSEFKTTVSLQNLADDIGLSIRTTQSKATGVQADQNLSFNGSFGIHFNTNTNPSNITEGSNKSFVFFNDANRSGKYNALISPSVCDGVTNECDDIVNITTDDQISSLCLDGVCNYSGTLDITFTRPNPDAHFCFISDTTYQNNSDPECGLSPYSRVGVELKNNTSGSFKYINVWNTGQIHIE